MKQIPIKVSNDGLLDHDFIHDSEIVGISIEGERPAQNLKITMKAEEGKRYFLVAKGISLLQSSSFCLQNVVFEIFIGHTRREISERSDLKEVFGSEQFYSGLLEKVDQGVQSYLQLDPSVGCDVACFAREFEMYAD